MDTIGYCWSKHHLPSTCTQKCGIFPSIYGSFRDPGSPLENGFMEAKYLAFRRWFIHPNHHHHHLTFGDWIPRGNRWKQRWLWVLQKLPLPVYFLPSSKDPWDERYIYLHLYSWFFMVCMKVNIPYTSHGSVMYAYMDGNGMDGN